MGQARHAVTRGIPFACQLSTTIDRGTRAGRHCRRVYMETGRLKNRQWSRPAESSKHRYMTILLLRVPYGLETSRKGKGVETFRRMRSTPAGGERGRETPREASSRTTRRRAERPQEARGRGCLPPQGKRARMHVAPAPAPRAAGSCARIRAGREGPGGII
jgi:hypothetical protein